MPPGMHEEQAKPKIDRWRLAWHDVAGAQGYASPHMRRVDEHWRGACGRSQELSATKNLDGIALGLEQLI